MSYLIYNGISTADLGLLVESMPAAKRAARQTETATPPGYDGAIITDNGAYNTFSASATLNCFGSMSPAEVFAVFTGEGWLTTSDRPTRRRYVYCYDEQSAARLRTSKCYDSVSIGFICDPYCYELTPETLTVNSGDFITGQGDIDARPLIKLTGTGAVTLMIGGVSLILSGLTADTPVYIDAATKFAYCYDGGDIISAYAAGVTVSMDTSISDRWPLLNHSGTTAVTWTGTVSACEITPNWRWF